MDRLFPKVADNTYTGHPIARWVFIFMTIVTIIRSLIHMFSADGGAGSIATIPLENFTDNGAAAVILAFALWGLSQLIVGLIYVVVLWRYQSLIPLMYVLMIFEYVMRIVLGEIKPIDTVSTPPGAIGDYVIIPLASVMLFLALRDRRRPDPDSE